MADFALRATTLTAVLVIACSGKITEDADRGSATSGATGGGAGSAGKGSATGGTATGGSGTGGSGSGGTGNSASGGSSGSASGGSSGDGPTVAGVRAVTRVARLTHTQYQNTVNDLFGITDNTTASFAPDALDGVDFDTRIDFRVDSRLGPQYRAAAETLAAKAVSDDGIFGRIVTCTPSAASCKSDFISGFGERAFRRPLTTDEVTRFTTLFGQGADLVASGDAFKDGVALVVEAMLQAPQFLYRTELSEKAESDGLINLSSWELASRLSYFLWNTMPSDALRASAKSSSLATSAQVKSAAATLVTDARTTSVAISFHHQAWDGRFSHIAPDAKTFPDAPPDLLARVTAATQAFYGDVFKTDGGLRQLLTAPYAFADSELAPLYGANVSSGTPVRIDFEPSERQGILMQVGFLASNAYAKKTDPIHRGLFVVRNLLCHEIDDPPAGASETPLPATDTPPKTTREEVSLLTGQSALCRGCHADINPPGFAFEAFDAVGQIREDEDGEPLDTTGEMLLDEQSLSFEGPLELVEALAGSKEARVCYSSKWLEYAYGRALITDDKPALDSVAGTEQSVRSVMQSVTQTPSFMRRAPNEVAK